MLDRNSDWDGPWGFDSPDYDGLHLEILADCVGSWAYPGQYTSADPDTDGVAEGCYSGCSSGGAGDSLSILMREVNNNVFHAIMDTLEQAGVPVILNCGNYWQGPQWRTDMTGVKLEGWIGSVNDAQQNSWSEWFEGVRITNDPNEVPGPGYEWAENNVYQGTQDDFEGWDHSIIESKPVPQTTEPERARLRRWGLGTSLLGDGFFTQTSGEAYPYWYPEYEWKFGEALGEYDVEQYGLSNLYVRHFTRGFVEVNPLKVQSVNGVPAGGSRFSFWPGIAQLTAQFLEPDTVRLDYSTGNIYGCVPDSILMRYATFPITPENWEDATPYRREVLPMVALFIDRDPGPPRGGSRRVAEDGHPPRQPPARWTARKPRSKPRT